MGVGPDHHVVAHGDDGVGSGDATPQHLLHFERPTAEREPLEEGKHLAQVGAGVQQAPESHVAGDAGKAVEPSQMAAAGKGRGGLRCRGTGHGSIRAMAQAAPNPLSMPTTTIPAAQDACMANNAVTPSRAAP